MPFVTIYKLHDKLWHLSSGKRDGFTVCRALITFGTIRRDIGRNHAPEPARSELCPTCFDFLPKQHETTHPKTEEVWVTADFEEYAKICEQLRAAYQPLPGVQAHDNR